MEDILLPADFHSVPGIVSPLGPEDPVGFSRHHIENFPFALVAPLKA